MEFKIPVGYKDEEDFDEKSLSKTSFAVGLKEKVGTLNYMAPEIISLSS